MDMKYGISDGDQTLKTTEYVWLANFTGISSLAIPVGFVVPYGVENSGEEAGDEVQGKIPVGLMGMGEWSSEEALLQWGSVAETLVDDRRCRPPIWVDVIEKAREWGKNGDERDE
jgi:Asp-tRNA(Asn)/Glu-tRNA(Gln) amidotransferase A subunit family amidase